MEHSNITAARRWFDEVWNRKNQAAIAECMPAHGICHTETGSVVGPEAFGAIYAGFVAALPDIQFTVEAAIAEGDLVALRWVAVGHHIGTGTREAPNGVPIEVRGCTWHRYEDGLVVEGWDFYNLGALMQRIS